MLYNVSLKQYEGPLDLLLSLIERAEIDIRDIFVSEITSQYIEYVNSCAELDIDLASDFITMAARLLYIKSRSLLPKPPKEQEEEEEDPEQALIRQLQEYKVVKAAAACMNDMFADAVAARTKLPEDFVLPEQETIFTGGTAEDLYKALRRVLKRLDEVEAVHIESAQVNADAYTVRGCMKSIREALTDRNVIEFDELFRDARVKLEVIVTFMALLEMIMRDEINIEQSEPYGTILISKNTLISNDEDISYMDEEQ